MTLRLTPSTHRRLLFAALLLVAVAVTGMVWERSAQAIGIGGPSFCQYFSDATYTTVVGTRSTGCCGGTTTTGTVTPYIRCQRVYCPDVLCPQAS